jgi:hypothetical protein
MNVADENFVVDYGNKVDNTNAEDGNDVDENFNGDDGDNINAEK